MFRRFRDRLCFFKYSVISLVSQLESMINLIKCTNVLTFIDNTLVLNLIDIKIFNKTESKKLKI